LAHLEEQVGSREGSDEVRVVKQKEGFRTNFWICLYIAPGQPLDLITGVPW
jgi:hypothetical protein